MSNQTGSPKPRMAAVGFSVAALAVFGASALALMTQSCAESSSAKEPTTNGTSTISATPPTPPPPKTTPTPPPDRIPPPT